MPMTHNLLSKAVKHQQYDITNNNRETNYLLSIQLDSCDWLCCCYWTGHVAQSPLRTGVYMLLSHCSGQVCACCPVTAQDRCVHVAQSLLRAGVNMLLSHCSGQVWTCCSIVAQDWCEHVAQSPLRTGVRCPVSPWEPRSSPWSSSSWASSGPGRSWLVPPRPRSSTQSRRSRRHWRRSPWTPSSPPCPPSLPPHIYHQEGI